MANSPKSEEGKESQKKSSFGKIFSKILLFLVILIVIGVSVYFYIQYQNTQKLLQNPTVVAAEETKSLLEKVSKIIELPQGEDPTIATVSDKSKLSDQAFFTNSQNGDKVLIFEKAKKAILYRPATGKIIEVAPVNDAVSQASAPAATTVTAKSSPTASPSVAPVKIKVAIYNGTQTAGLAASYAKKITAEVSNIEVVEKSNAAGNYTSSIVIDLTGKNNTVAVQLASVIDGAVGTLPKGEEMPSADILIIVGE